MPIFGPKCQFWAKFGRFWAQNPIFWGQGVKILVPSYRDSNETSFSCWKHWSVGLQLAARGKNVLFWPQNLDIWGQKSIFWIVIAIFVDGANDHYTRGYNFPNILHYYQLIIYHCIKMTYQNKKKKWYDLLCSPTIAVAIVKVTAHMGSNSKS